MKQKTLIILIALLAIGVIVYAAIPDSRKAIAEYAPLALVLLCPVIMLFGMHGNHWTAEKKDSNKDNSKQNCH